MKRPTVVVVLFFVNSNCVACANSVSFPDNAGICYAKHVLGFIFNRTDFRSIVFNCHNHISIRRESVRVHKIPKRISDRACRVGLSFLRDKLVLDGTKNPKKCIIDKKKNPTTAAGGTLFFRSTVSL